jgi:hypothetical protein
LSFFSAEGQLYNQFGFLTRERDVDLWRVCSPRIQLSLLS